MLEVTLWLLIVLVGAVLSSQSAFDDLLKSFITDSNLVGVLLILCSLLQDHHLCLRLIIV